MVARNFLGVSICLGRRPNSLLNFHGSMLMKILAPIQGYNYNKVDFQHVSFSSFTGLGAIEKVGLYRVPQFPFCWNQNA